MKTAMQELFEKFGHLLPNIETEYLENEKQQIRRAFNVGGEAYEMSSEDYYTSEFETNKETLK